MRKMTATEARSTNGGYKVWECSVCKWWIMVGFVVYLAGLTQYSVRPTYCPHCGYKANWKRVYI